MTITPNDILEKEFNNKFRGYDPEQVNDFLDIVRVQLEKTLEENHNLSRDLTEANDKIAYFSQLQESLNSSIIIAQEAAERLKQNARKEAELILYEAESEASRVIDQANAQSNEIFEEAERLRTVTKEYRQELRNLIEGQLAIVNNTSFENLFDGTALTPAQTREQRPVMSNRLDHLVEQSEHEAEEDLSVTQVFDLNDLREISKAEVKEEEDFPSPSMPLSREELEAFEQNHSGNVESFDEIEADHTDLHGETIRIDLPTED
ncbi:DivIVA domain-containing protein [Facklamia miroungae]|uniref:DivIVA domain-containing protein n=1 Tax=Facklamia miroungae TaxID=120956 RepID=A0A1G7TUG5_9LACT|nr:DivIVA domain-containing protein [Facklamia miroungae]NKZ29975.1 DivIVA domain-containing protein [Facklamia miroungae]SDG38905.1 DivIVA domain-containing protein [Facklamia miroungae]